MQKGDRRALEVVLRRIEAFDENDVEVALELIDDWLDKGEQSEYNFVVAAEHDAVFGFACYGPIPLTESSFDLYWIAVAPDHRREGIGRRLLECVEGRVAEQRGRRIYVDTSSRAQYAQARALYSAMGYVEAARFPDFYREGEAKIVYCKTLPSRAES